MKDKKERIPIPKNVAADVLYASDRTCCICNEKGKSVQIHHIDEDPANNSKENLAVLCFECHEDTQIKGGFGRKLDAEQVMKYKVEWVDRVSERRKQSDQLASLKTTGNEKLIEPEEPAEPIRNYYDYLHNYMRDFEHIKDQEAKRLTNYLNKISELKATVYKYAQHGWDDGATQTMNQSSYDVVSFYEEIMNELAEFYPFEHFEGESKKFFSDVISSKFKWHRYIRDTFGIGMNGTMVSTIVAGAGMGEVDIMVQEMVENLCEKYEIEFEPWVETWKAASQ